MRSNGYAGAITWLVVLALLGCGFAGLAQTRVDGTPFERVIGLSLPTFGRVHYSDEGIINRLTGFNLGLGYSVRYYWQGFEPEEISWYWGWGTVALILPYLELGISYALPVGEMGNLLVIDAGVFYLAPRLGIALYY